MLLLFVLRVWLSAGHLTNERLLCKESKGVSSHKGVCLQCATGTLSPLGLFSHGKELRAEGLTGECCLG